MARPKEPLRTLRTRQDLGAIDAIQYNDAAGAQKNIDIEPAIVRATLANEIVGAGKLIKIAAAPYGIDLLGRDYDSGYLYQKGDVAAESGNIYLCMQDQVTGTFDATKWKKVAEKQIVGITSTAGNIVTTGRWHNAITVAGWLVDDDTEISYMRVRD